MLKLINCINLVVMILRGLELLLEAIFIVRQVMIVMNRCELLIKII